MSAWRPKKNDPIIVDNLVSYSSFIKKTICKLVYVFVATKQLHYKRMDETYALSLVLCCVQLNRNLIPKLHLLKLQLSLRGCEVFFFFGGGGGSLGKIAAGV